MSWIINCACSIRFSRDKIERLNWGSTIEQERMKTCKLCNMGLKNRLDCFEGYESTTLYRNNEHVQIFLLTNSIFFVDLLRILRSIEMFTVKAVLTVINSTGSQPSWSNNATKRIVSNIKASVMKFSFDVKSRKRVHFLRFCPPMNVFNKNRMCTHTHRTC